MQFGVMVVETRCFANIVPRWIFPRNPVLTCNAALGSLGTKRCPAACHPDTKSCLFSVIPDCAHVAVRPQMLGALGAWFLVEWLAMFNQIANRRGQLSLCLSALIVS